MDGMYFITEPGVDLGWGKLGGLPLNYLLNLEKKKMTEKTYNHN